MIIRNRLRVSGCKNPVWSLFWYHPFPFMFNVRFSIALYWYFCSNRMFFSHVSCINLKEVLRCMLKTRKDDFSLRYINPKTIIIIIIIITLIQAYYLRPSSFLHLKPCIWENHCSKLFLISFPTQKLHVSAY